MIKEIAHFIASITSFEIGTTLQVAHRTQDAPDRCNVVLETAGGAVHPDLPDRIDKNIQIISRADNYMDAHDDAWEIFRALFGTLEGSALPFGERTLPAVAPATQDYKAMTITPLADPQWIGQDEKKRFEFSCNYIWRIQNL